MKNSSRPDFKLESQSIDDIPLEFGKYKGISPNKIAESDPSYIVWMYDTITPKKCTKDLAIACESDDRDYDEEMRMGSHFLDN